MLQSTNPGQPESDLTHVWAERTELLLTVEANAPHDNICQPPDEVEGDAGEGCEDGEAGKADDEEDELGDGELPVPTDETQVYSRGALDLALQV